MKYDQYKNQYIFILQYDTMYNDSYVINKIFPNICTQPLYIYGNERDLCKFKVKT